MKVKKITKVKARRVYAITTSTGTFIADGLAHHNCAGCNIWGHGKYAIFTHKLIKELGLEKYEEIVRISNTTLKYSESDYERIYNEYKQKVDELTSNADIS